MSTQNVIPGWTMAIPVVLMVVAGWSTNLPIPAQWKLIGVRFSVVAACTFPVVGFFASASTPRLGTFLFGYFIFLAAAVYNFRLWRVCPACGLGLVVPGRSCSECGVFLPKGRRVGSAK